MISSRPRAWGPHAAASPDLAPESTRPDDARPASWRAVLLVAPLLLLVFAQPFFRFTDPDYWWHVRTGAYIVAHRALPWVDPFSFTAAGKPWVTHEWLTEVISYLVAQRAGYVGNVVIFGLIGAASQLLVYLACRRRGIGVLGSGLLLLWSYLLKPALYNVVPQLFSIFFLALCAYLLTRYRQGDRRAIWLLPPILGLWGNLHGGFLAGFGLVGLTLAGELAARHRRLPAAPWAPLLAALVASVPAVLINPNGPRILTYSLAEGGPLSSASQLVTNFQSPDFHNPLLLPFLITVALSVALGLGRRSLGPTDLLWALAFSVLGLQSNRHISLYAVVVVPILGARLAEVVPALRREATLLRRPSVYFGAWLLLVAALAPGVAIPANASALQVGREPQVGNLYPAGGVEYLKAHRLAGNLFSEYVWGGYLIYELYPEQKVFVDGRIDVYGSAFVERFINTIKGGPGWKDVLDSYDVRTVLVDRHDALASLLEEDPGWREVYRGPIEKLFVRSDR